MTHYTISQVARKFGLSRSTLLYYDSIGLLAPRGRSASGYRLYCEADLERMATIQIYREAGLSLHAIGEMLHTEGGALRHHLDERLGQIHAEIGRLRNQQRVIVNLLQNDQALPRTRVLDKQRWVALLRASGLDEAGMRRWHVEFEAMSPEAHQDFLASIGIPANEIEAIREWSRAGDVSDLRAPHRHDCS